LKQSIRKNIFYIGDCVSDGYAAIEAETDFIGLANDYSYSHPIRMIEFVKLNAEKAKHISNFIDIIKI
jgi:phosphoglycolate phosphatase-like HAD superfamily hydrolase